ncbi:MAG: prolipoprotein diacylglyceryl transferase [Actinomycetota bacterium]
MILADAFKFQVDPLSWTILPTFDIGPLSLSPHGLGIAVGFFIGAQFMVRRARRLGGPAEGDIWNMLFYCLLGAIAGARLAYVLGHFSEVTDGGDDLLGIFKVWEGGISLLGGITGGALAGLPYARVHRMGFWRTADLVAPGLALGIAVGRIGDLIIGDHLGKRTDFFLGWRCLGEAGEGAAQSADAYRQAVAAGEPPSIGCFDVTVHQTALYDFVSSWVLFGVLLWLGRRVKRRGLLAVTFVIWYGAMRVITDFLRVDKRYFGLTGSQITALVLGLVCAYLLARYRGAPPRYAEPPGPPTTEGDESASQIAATGDSTTERSGQSGPDGA